MRVLAVVSIFVFILCSSAPAVTLEVWHGWPEADRTIQALAYRYTQQTGVSIHIRTTRPTPRMSWGSYSGPDLAILYQPTRRDIEYMATRGLIQDIRVEVSRGWYALFWPGFLDTFTLGASVYGIPLTGEVHVFIYNKSMFQKAGVGIPRSWNELMAASPKLRRIGVTPYAGGFGSNMPPLAAAYEYSYLGQHLLTQTYLGRYRYTAPLWLAYLKVYTEMRRSGFTNASSARMTETEAIYAFLNGRVAMIFADTNFERIRASYKPSFTGWGAFDAPEDGRARFGTKLPGHVSAGLVINSHSPRKAQAIAFARWLTEYSQQLALGGGTTTIPAMTVAANSAKLSPPVGVFVSAGMRDMAMDLRIYESSQVLATFYSGVVGIIAGTSTPAATARRTQRVKTAR